MKRASFNYSKEATYLHSVLVYRNIMSTTVCPQPLEELEVQQQQWLVSFQSKTHVFLFKEDCSVDELYQEIQDRLSFTTGWPVSRLVLDKSSLYATSTTDASKSNGDFRHVRVRVQSSLRGGKGGFGTLLRSSARQSGANLTTDFGACRDLQGRRLRHVNDEIKLRKWREAQEAKEKGIVSGDAADAMFDTPSGLYNWHLMVPSWADISKKATRKIQRQFKRMQQAEDKIEQEKQEKKAQYERSVTMYVQKGTESSNKVKNDVMSAVKEGLRVQNEKKRKHQELQQRQLESTALEAFQNEDRPNSLCALSGDVVVEEARKGDGKTVLQIQSQSDFSTLALFLDKPAPKATKAVSSVLYYEVRLVTGGLAQIGWADMTCQDFHPNSEEGEGVGDDKGSFGYDGSRGLKFHNGTEEVFPNSTWKAGDVVGCHYNLKTGDVSYSVNGTDLGVAFTVPAKQPGKLLFPGISCNGGEILELHIREEEMEYLPVSTKRTHYIAAHELVAASITDGEIAASDSSCVDHTDGDKKPRAIEAMFEEPKETEAIENNENDTEKPKEPVKVEAIDLSQYESAEALEKLGLDRLKGALMAIGVKCG